MRSAIISITFLLIMFKFSWAQDTITRKTGVKIICNIIKFDSINIHYHLRIKNGTIVKTFLPLEGVSEYKYGPKLERPNFWFNVGVGAGTVIGGFDSNHTDNAVGPSFGINFSSQIKQERDVQLYGAVYAEVLKNLETLKLDMARETPLVQLIDQPRLPLIKDKLGKAKGIIFGGLLGGFLIVSYLLGMMFVKDKLKEL